MKIKHTCGLTSSGKLARISWIVSGEALTPIFSQYRVAYSSWMIFCNTPGWILRRFSPAVNLRGIWILVSRTVCLSISAQATHMHELGKIICRYLRQQMTSKKRYGECHSTFRNSYMFRNVLSNPLHTHRQLTTHIWWDFLWWISLLNQ